jgi:hypothetical protein
MKITFPMLLGLLFIGLKLGHVIVWSWWLVLLPLYLVPVLLLAVLAVTAGLAGIAVVLADAFTTPRRPVNARQPYVRTR